MTPSEPVAEPLKRTLSRNLSLAAVVGLAIALSSRNLRAWPFATLLASWFALGGHYVEIGYLRLLRPRLRAARPVQIAARLLVWFGGGVGLGFGMALTARAVLGAWPARAPAWYWGGLMFVGIELVVHAVLALRRLPSFYSGRG